jgi:serine/threonine protein phosphatase PrpC
MGRCLRSHRVRTREDRRILKPEGCLDAACGHASETGRRADNQDFAGVYLATATERARHGMIAAVADGVGGAKGGRMAAELAVRALIDGLYDLIRSALRRLRCV